MSLDVAVKCASWKVMGAEGKVCWHPREKYVYYSFDTALLLIMCVGGESSTTLLRKHKLYVCVREEFYHFAEKAQIVSLCFESTDCMRVRGGFYYSVEKAQITCVRGRLGILFLVLLC